MLVDLTVLLVLVASIDLVALVPVDRTALTVKLVAGPNILALGLFVALVCLPALGVLTALVDLEVLVAISLAFLAELEAVG